MSYQPDYEAAIREAERIVGSQRAEAVVMALIKSGEMVCVPEKVRNHTGRKTQGQLSDENAALRDWMGVLIDECCAMNYQQYIDYAKKLLRRLYGKDSERPMPPLAVITAADWMAHYADQATYGTPELRAAVRTYRSVRGPQ